MLHLAMRESNYRDANKQRQIISDELSEKNIKSLTKFSLVFDLLGLNNQNEIRQFSSCYSDSQSSADQSAFILYNLARLNAILEKFETLKKEGKPKLRTRFIWIDSKCIVLKGTFKREMPLISELNFFALIKSEYEKEICEKFLFKFEALVDEILASVIQLPGGSLQSKVNTSKVIKFLSDLSIAFSKYYSKIHVLEVENIQVAWNI